jgi:hypothetical protein
LRIYGFIRLVVAECSINLKKSEVKIGANNKLCIEAGLVEYSKNSIESRICSAQKITPLTYKKFPSILSDNA